MENKDTIPIRFILKEVSKRDYEQYYSLCPRDYVPIFRKKTIKGVQLGATLLIKMADVGDWRKDYLAEHNGYSCLKCEDTGVNHTEKGWTPCSGCKFGENVKRYWREERERF